MMAGSTALACANAGAAVAWVVPTYKNARPVWRFAEHMTLPIVSRLKVNRSERVIEFPSGGWLGVYTADNPVSILGEAFDLVIVEEAARIASDVWSETIMPTLADRAGRAMLISTPKGINWFAREWHRGEDAMNGEYAAWTAPSSDNPSPNIRRAALLARERVPLRTYQQEWLAEFVTDGSYFQNVDAVCTLTAPDAPADHPGHHFSMGLDWGKSNDFTVGTIGCRECDRVVDWFRFNGFDYVEQRRRVKGYADKWTVSRCKRCSFVAWGWHDDCPQHHGKGDYASIVHDAPRVLPERNSIGEPNIEMLRRDGLNIQIGPDNKFGFETTATTKPAMIELLYEALMRGKRYPREYADELRAYEVATRSDGKPKFGAPEGQHDDRVMSAALENWQAGRAVQVTF